MPTPSLKSLAAAATFNALVKQCEARVASRQWASDDLTSPEPYYFERNQYARGRKLAKQPPASHDAKHHGYDDVGRIARIRTWSGFLGRWHEEELFVPTGDDVIVAYRFRCDGTLMNVDRYTHDAEGRLLVHEMYAAEAKRSGSQRYVWNAGVLERVEVTNWGNGWSLDWDKDGELRAISSVYDDGQTAEVYRRPAKGESLTQLFEVIYARLLEVIPRVASRMKPKSKAYALLLVLDEEEWRHALPPALALGFETDRERIRSENPKAMRDLLWSAADVPSFDAPGLELRDARLSDAAKRANQHLWQAGTQNKAKALMRRLARELQALDWSALRAVSDDFVVYVTTLEGDGERHVRRDAPAAIKKRLIARGEL